MKYLGMLRERIGNQLLASSALSLRKLTAVSYLTHNTKGLHGRTKHRIFRDFDIISG
jgi:hypothetical protein